MSLERYLRRKKKIQQAQMLLRRAYSAHREGENMNLRMVIEICTNLIEDEENN